MPVKYNVFCISINPQICKDANLSPKAHKLEVVITPQTYLLTCLAVEVKFHPQI